MISLLTLFSFYYADRIIDLSKREDPIMEKIISRQEENSIGPVNSIIEGGFITVGISGREVDIEKSYEKMKKLKKYSDNLLEYINVKPSISIEGNLDKRIKGSVRDDRVLAIVFKTNDIDMLKQIDYILDKNEMDATIFMNAKVIEDNLVLIKNSISNHIYFGVYDYNNTFNNISTKYVKKLLFSNLNYSNYCLYKDELFIKSCKYYKISTIDPVFIRSNVYNYFKTNKENGLIYEIGVTKNNIKELNSTLLYLNQKGYSVTNLDMLLKQ